MAVNKTIYEIELLNNFTKPMGKIIAAAKKFDDQFKKSTQGVSQSFDKLKNKSNETTAKIKSNNTGLTSSFGSVKRAIIGAAGAFGVYKIAEFSKEVVNLKADFESYDNTLKASSSSVEEYRKNKAFLSQTIDSLGLGMKSTTKAFSKFSGATKGSAMEGEKTRELFLAMSQAGTVLGLDQEALGRSFVAFSQMASKGTISSEELKQQLGDSLPGALKLASQAMGVSTEKLLDMMKKGQLLSDEFLPNFTKQLTKTYGEDSKKAAKSLRSNMNRISNAFIKFKLLVGDSMGEAGVGFMTFFNELKSFVVENKQAFKDFFYVLGVGFRNMFSLFALGIRWIRENKEEIKNITTAIIGGSVALGAFVTWQKASVLWTQRKIVWDKIQLLWTKRLAIWQGILSASMALVPALIFAAGAAIVWAWQKFEKFRGVIGGIVEYIKSDLIPSLTILWKLIAEIGKTIWYSITGQWSKIGDSWKTTLDELKTMSAKAAEKTGSAYQKGFENAVKNGKIELPSISKTLGVDSILNARDEENRKRGILAIAQEALDRKNGILPTAAPISPPTKPGDKPDSLGSTTSGASTTKSTNINISIDSLIKDTKFYTNNVQENTSRIEELTAMALMKVLNNANNLANG